MKGNSVILLLWKDTLFSLLKLSDPEVNSLNVSRPVSPPSCVALRSHNEPSAQCGNKCSVVFGSLHQQERSRSVIVWSQISDQPRNLKLWSLRYLTDTLGPE